MLDSWYMVCRVWRPPFQLTGTDNAGEFDSLMLRLVKNLPTVDRSPELVPPSRCQLRAQVLVLCTFSVAETRLSKRVKLRKNKRLPSIQKPSDGYVEYASSHKACLANAAQYFPRERSWRSHKWVAAEEFVHRGTTWFDYGSNMATEVPLDPSAPEAATRKARDLAASELLNRAFESPGHVMERVAQECAE